MKFPIAVQLYSVRDDMANDFEGTLRAVKEMGYDGVEFAGLHGRTPAYVKELCKEIGLVPISAHVSFAEMLSNPDVFSDYAQIGCKYIVIPHMGLDYLPGSDRFEKTANEIKAFGEKARSLGMKLGYHNHDFEFGKVGEEYILDILYKTVDASLLEAQLDTCWVKVGGEDPAAYVSKYADRVHVIHLKDFVGSKSENMYALIGVDENEKKDTHGKFEFRPVGLGLQNFPEILKAAEAACTEWVVVEQDMPSMGLSALESIRASVEYLRAL